MKYYISEGIASQKLNAASKAREDVRAIVDELGYASLRIPTKNGVQTKKIMKPYQAFVYLKNYYVWQRELNQLKPGDEIIVEYPLMNTTLLMDRAIRKATVRGIKTTAIIHDLNSLRFVDMPRVAYEDKQVLDAFQKVVSHNESMTAYLTKLGVEKEKLVNLQIFDYLYQDSNVNCTDGDEGIIIAGNLAPEKAGYLSGLHKVENVAFNLYGIGYEKNEWDTNLDYRGAFKPDELIANLKGQYGLVWDGTSVDECNGIYGEYLRYNNPHKASLYLAAGIPLVVWKQSALAPFVQKYGLGLCVESLQELESLHSDITTEKYAQIKENVDAIGCKVRQGYFLKEVLVGE